MIPDFVGPVAILSMLIPIVAMGITLWIVLYAINRNYKIKQLEYEARIRAIEKGYDVPVEPPKRKPNYPFTWPFVFAGFGLALFLIWVFNGFHDEEALGFGLIFLFIGLALFASRYYGAKKEEMENNVKQAKQSWQAPQSSEKAGEMAGRIEEQEKREGGTS